MLKPFYAKDADIPEALKEYYKQEGDKWVLQAEGLVPKVQVDEYRTNNVNLLKKIQEMQDQYGNIDPKKHKELLDAQAKAEEDALKAKGQYDELERRLKTSHEEQTKGLNSTIGLLKQSLKDRIIDGLVAANAEQVAVLKPGNLRFVQLDARKHVDIEDFDKLVTSADGLSKLEEKVFVRGPDGKPRFTKEGKPMVLKDFLSEYFSGDGAGLVGETKGLGSHNDKQIFTPGTKNIPASSLGNGDVSGDLISKLASGEVSVVAG